MRVIAGKAKGHRLKVPKGYNIRPTSELVREAAFSMLEAIGINWEYVLDLYAGTGALGIEALSRGACWVDFVEQRPDSCDIIKQNLEKTGLDIQAHVYYSSVNKALSFLNRRYDLILMDPPYSISPEDLPLQQLASSNLVGGGSVIVVVHSVRLALDSAVHSLHLIKQRRYGDSCISIYRKESYLDHSSLSGQLRPSN